MEYDASTIFKRILLLLLNIQGYECQSLGMGIPMDFMIFITTSRKICLCEKSQIHNPYELYKT